MHTTKSQFYDYRDILEIYPEDTVSMDMVAMLSQVLRYYKNGDEWHRRHFTRLDRDEYEYHVTFLKELRELMENMCIEEESSLIIQDENIKLNLNPWITFTQKYKLSEILLTLRAIKDCMLAYLSADSIMEYRESLHIVNRWELSITEMIRKGGSYE